MIDFGGIVGFVWDDGNRRKSDDKHDVTQAEAEQMFFNEPLLVIEDIKHSAAEPRFHALGQTIADRRLHVSFTLRQQAPRIRVISARDMSRRERAFYEQET